MLNIEKSIPGPTNETSQKLEAEAAGLDEKIRALEGVEATLVALTLRSGTFLGCLYLCPTKSKLQKLGSRPRRQQAWEDNLSTLNAEENSLWGIAKAFRKKNSSQISALNGPTGIALSDTNKTEVIAHSLEKQFHLNDIHNPRKDEIITSVVDAYMDSNINNTDIIPHSPICNYSDH
ncbi:uncharacterized protein TNCV_3160951 [Trichonephila clavipes]|nr:uncharacterized protein TNCV_3160951 [Trichonephila clavipes]